MNLIRLIIMKYIKPSDLLIATKFLHYNGSIYMQMNI